MSRSVKRWRKLGCVFVPTGEVPWMRSHAANPIAEHRQGDEFRIYFGCRDEQSRTHIGAVDIDLAEPTRILSLSTSPVLAPGETGLFDDSGVSVGCLVRHGDRRYLYYVGWNLSVTVPWRNSIGLAIAEGPDQPFEKVSPAPVLDRHAVDPYSLSYPWVTVEGDRWRMWYGSNLKWGAGKTDMDHVIKIAESADGIAWRRNGEVAIPLGGEPGEFAVARPCVLRDGDRYRMWYSRRGDRYRMGYAESADGVRWRRLDQEAGIEAAPDGWENNWIEYASVFDHSGHRYMLYNGFGYGRTGFGLAVLD